MRNLTKVVGIRFDEGTHELIVRVSAAQGVDLSDFVRKATMRELARLSFLSAEQKKALEVNVGGELSA